MDNGTNSETTSTPSHPVDPMKGLRNGASASRAKRNAKKSTKKIVKRNAKKSNGTKRLTKAEIKAANPSGKCLCGCGKEVSRRFLQGHDAQLHGAVLEAFKAEKTVRVSKATAEYLKTAPWMDSKLAKTIRS